VTARRRPFGLLGLGAACALACLLGAVLVPSTFFPAYLAAAMAMAAIPIGCLFVLMISCLVGGRWVEVLRAPLEFGSAMMPAVGLLFVPVLLGLKWIYPWAREPVEAAVPAFKQAWLSIPFFATRTVALFAIFSLIALALLRVRDPSRRRRIASGGLIVVTLLASFAGIDWGMSVEPRFHSSIYGLIFIGGALLSGLAFALLGAVWRGRDDPGKGGLGGALLISAIMLWAYFHAMQYVVMWSADIPLEAAWYLRRGEGIWGGLLWLLALGQFAVPFLVLLFRSARTSTVAISLIAVATLVLRFVETAWLVLPPMEGLGVSAAILVLAATGTIAGLSAAGAQALLGRVALTGVEADRVTKAA
jgi:hypothetical protein